MSQSLSVNKNRNASPRPASGQAVQTSIPDSSAEVVVRSSPGGSLNMGFDPSTATASRPANDNDLVGPPVESVEPVSPPPFAPVIVDESFLPDLGSPYDKRMPERPIEVPEGYTVNTKGWFDGENGEFFIPVPNGLLSYSENGGLTYTLLEATSEHTLPGQPDEDRVSVKAPVTLQDAAGNLFPMEVPIIILDDAPVGGRRIHLAGVEGEKREGDGGIPSDVVSYASGNLGADFFTFGADGPGKDALWVTGLNGSRETDLTVTAYPDGKPADLGPLFVTQKFIPETEFIKNTLVVTLEDVKHTAAAELTLSADGEWTYTQYYALAHPEGGGANGMDLFLRALGTNQDRGPSLTITDSDGDTATVVLSSFLTDAVPTLDMATGGETDESASHSVLFGGTVSGDCTFAYGADGAADSAAFTVTDGAAIYTLGAEENGFSLGTPFAVTGGQRCNCPTITRLRWSVRKTGSADSGLLRKY
jgi:hypothetical protein